MSKILVIGAGRSSSSLFRYLFKQAPQHNWQITIADYDLGLVQEKIGNNTATAMQLDIQDEKAVSAVVEQSDIVISLLPAHLHIKLAKICLTLRTHLITASYISPEFKEMRAQLEQAGIIFLMECGLDPGIDHMTAKKAIDFIHNQGGEIQSFKSFTGGLVAPQYDNNPWNYKFTWNPRNVVLAGQGTVKFIRNGKYKYIPYHRLFNRIEQVKIDGFGAFEAYPNRDSLSYRGHYGLENIPTILRGTLRRPGFCAAWNAFVQLGITDDTYKLEQTYSMTYREFINTFLPFDLTKSVEVKFCECLGLDPEGEIFKKITWLGLFEEQAIELEDATPAQILQKRLEQKWALEAEDKDLIVMQHQFEYNIDGEQRRLVSSMASIGDNTVHTAMAKTVGLPLGIACKLILQGKVTERGLLMPNIESLYAPIVQELEQEGIQFMEEDSLVG